MTQERLAEALRRVDAHNAEDPQTALSEGEPVPKELLYGRRMSARLDSFAPDASDVVRLAVRAQHIGRFRVPRSAYPEGRAGYLTWRTELAKRHAETAGEIARAVGYDEAFVARLAALLRKRGLKTDPEVQLLEDVACLVFLEHYFADFARTRTDDEVVPIVRKTWGKMSEAAHAVALGLPLGPRELGVVQKALGG